MFASAHEAALVYARFLEPELSNSMEAAATAPRPVPDLPEDAHHCPEDDAQQQADRLAAKRRPSTQVGAEVRLTRMQPGVLSEGGELTMDEERTSSPQQQTADAERRARTRLPHRG
jgi:hypothetical protein